MKRMFARSEKMRAATRAALERMKAIPSDELLVIGAENADGDISRFLRVTASHSSAECGEFFNGSNFYRETGIRTVVLTGDATLIHYTFGETEDRNDYLVAGSFGSSTDHSTFSRVQSQHEVIKACNTPYYQDVEMLAA